MGDCGWPSKPKPPCGDGGVGKDLKPANFFLTKTGSLKMGDFGIAKSMAGDRR